MICQYLSLLLLKDSQFNVIVRWAKLFVDFGDDRNDCHPAVRLAPGDYRSVLNHKHLFFHNI